MTKMSPEMSHFASTITEFLPYLLREISRREKSALTKGSISLPQMLVMDLLNKRYRAKMKDLARFLSIKMSSATALIDRLVLQKMLTRAREEKDRRVVWVAITEKGKKVIDEIYREKRKSVAAIFGVLDKSDRAQYLRIITKLKTSLM